MSVRPDDGYEEVLLSAGASAGAGSTDTEFYENKRALWYEIIIVLL